MSNNVFVITEPNKKYLTMGDYNSADVKKLQEILNSLGYNCGASDGIFGKSTREAVMKLQGDYGLTVDGIVGASTIEKINDILSGKAEKKSSTDTEGSIGKAINVTAAFEGSGYANVTGNFDGMGISVGILQWNIGQNTLPPLFNEMINKYPDVAKKIFNENYNELVNMLKKSHNKQLEWAKSINDSNNRIKENWKSQLIALCHTKEFQEIQIEKMQSYINMAYKICDEYGLVTERALALGFDIAVQNGSIKQEAKQQISRQALERSSEKELLAVIAKAVADATSSKWRSDVLSRKMTIVNGIGVVHGTKFNLEKQFGLSDAVFK